MTEKTKTASGNHRVAKKGNSKALIWFAQNLLGWTHWRKRNGSRYRLVMRRLVIYASIGLWIEAIWSQIVGIESSNLFLAFCIATLSTAYFSYAVVIISFQSTKSFQLSSRRLFLNTLLSSAFLILSFAHIYRASGLNGPDPKTALDYLYFSAVTFSTLGFGDFNPANTMGRLVAALQALLGNLHLAFLAGALFLRMARKSDGKASVSKPPKT